MSCKFAEVCNMRALFICRQQLTLPLPFPLLLPLPLPLPLVTAQNGGSFLSATAAARPLIWVTNATVNVAIHIKIIVCKRHIHYAQWQNPTPSTCHLPPAGGCLPLALLRQMILKMQFGQKMRAPWLASQRLNSITTHLAIRVTHLQNCISSRLAMSFQNSSCNSIASQDIDIRCLLDKLNARAQ